jgi:hypothetical protein
VILPQAFRNMLPVLLTQTIILFQDTSLVYIITAHDLLHGFTVAGKNFNLSRSARGLHPGRRRLLRHLLQACRCWSSAAEEDRHHPLRNPRVHERQTDDRHQATCPSGTARCRC